MGPSSGGLSILLTLSSKPTALNPKPYLEAVQVPREEAGPAVLQSVCELHRGHAAGGATLWEFLLRCEGLDGLRVYGERAIGYK